MGVVVIADSRAVGAAAQVGEALAVDGLPDCVIGTVAFDPRAMSAFTGPSPQRTRLRSPLLRSSASLAQVVHGQLHVRRIDVGDAPVPASSGLEVEVPV